MGNDTMKPVSAFLKVTRCMILIICLSGTVIANAGKHPYQQLGPEISHTVKEILKKHGMPVDQNKDNGWFKMNVGADSWIGGNPMFLLRLYKSHEIPIAAQLDIIQYCMKLHESRGRKEIIRIEIRVEPWKIKMNKPKPFFELTLNAIEKPF